MSGPAKVSTATVRPFTTDAATFSSTRLPSCRRSSKAPASRVTGPSKVTVRLLTIDRWADPSLTTTLATRAGATICTGELPSSGARSDTAALFPMTALFRGHRLYVHSSGGRVAAGSITLRGTLAVNSLPLMRDVGRVQRRDHAGDDVVEQAGAVRVDAHDRVPQDVRPDDGRAAGKRGVPRPRSTPMMYSPPIACVGAIGPAISAGEDHAVLPRGTTSWATTSRPGSLRARVGGEEIPDRVGDRPPGRSDLPGLRPATGWSDGWKIAGHRRPVAGTSGN